MVDQVKSLGELNCRRVTVFNDDDFKFGSGAFGIVYKAERDGTPCAAKVLHSYLGNSQPLQQFFKEIEIGSKLYHENIVQYLGVHRDDTISRVPILLMELMDRSLTSYLEDKSVNSISYREQLKICHDILRALVFLHDSCFIVHRDLSSNNILLKMNDNDGDNTISVAKVGDFGGARACDLTPNRLSTCPGTLPYMPPEAITSEPNYTEKIDCFSFGVLIVQILTRLFPNPSENQFVRIDGSNPPVYRPVPEVVRRQDHINKIDSNAPLLSVAKICLSNDPDDRPSAQSMSESIESLMKLQFEWSGEIQGHYEVSRYCNAITTKGIIYLLPADSTNIYAYDLAKDHWNHRYTSRYLGSSLAFINNELTTIGGRRLDVHMTFRHEAATYASCYTNKLWSVDMEVENPDWTNKLPSMPTRRAFTVSLNTGANLIVAGGIGGAYLMTIEIMDIGKSQWMTAADLPQRMWGASGTLCSDSVYLLGGVDKKSLFTVFTCSVNNLLKSCKSGSLKSVLTNVFTLGRSGVTSENVWTRLADIPVTQATCVSVHDCVLAIGGKDSNDKPTTDIHMYNQVTRTWLAVDHIPSARYSCFTIVHDNKIFIIGGKDDKGTPTSTMSVATIATTN